MKLRNLLVNYQRQNNFKDLLTMESSHATTILWTAASVTLGVIFGSLRSKIFSSKYNTKLHYYFYGFAGLVFLMSLFFVFKFGADFFAPDNWSWFGIIGLFAAAVSSVGLFLLTKKHLIFEEPPVVVEAPPVKDTYTTDELNPIVIKWTAKADKDEIKLFGGDLDFFGKTPGEMAGNSQYTNLCSMEFGKVYILCEEPNDATKKIRYGKILSDLPTAELRFYHPLKADLKVRGRIIQMNGSYRLLIYLRVDKNLYKAIETDTADSTGALYNNIWDLTWSMANQPDVSQLESYKKLFSGK
jgi:hypothetical protein